MYDIVIESDRDYDFITYNLEDHFENVVKVKVYAQCIENLNVLKKTRMSSRLWKVYAMLNFCMFLVDLRGYARTTTSITNIVLSIVFHNVRI